MNKPTVSEDGTSLVIRVPMALARHRPRKRIIAPENPPNWAPAAPCIDSTLIKAIARSFRWRRMIETGIHTTVDDIAAAEKINPSYVSRIMRLSLLASALIEAILDGRQSTQLSLERLLKPFPESWQQQAATLPTSRSIKS